MKILLEVAAVETNTFDKGGASPLLYAMETAIQDNDYSVVQLLLDSGSAAMKQHNGAALRFCCRPKIPPSVELLVKAGAVDKMGCNI